jgi:hypothetical protein
MTAPAIWQEAIAATWVGYADLHYPRTPFLMNRHIAVIASRLAAVRDGRIRGS